MPGPLLAVGRSSSPTPLNQAGEGGCGVGAATSRSTAAISSSSSPGPRSSDPPAELRLWVLGPRPVRIWPLGPGGQGTTYLLIGWLPRPVVRREANARD